MEAGQISIIEKALRCVERGESLDAFRRMDDVVLMEEFCGISAENAYAIASWIHNRLKPLWSARYLDEINSIHAKLETLAATINEKKSAEANEELVESVRKSDGTTFEIMNRCLEAHGKKQTVENQAAWIRQNVYAGGN